MSCCGARRREWARGSNATRSAPVVVDHAPTPGAERSPRWFEFTGHGTLLVNGPVTGQPYFFSGVGSRLPVSWEDSFALMGEVGLRVVAGA